MNIAIISKPWTQIPPQKYGGIERVVTNLVEELSKKHQVSLFAPGNSKPNPKVHLYSLFKHAMGDKGLDRSVEQAQATHALMELQTMKDIDIIHAHGVDPLLGAAPFINKPIIFSFHSVPNQSIRILSELVQEYVHFTFVSKAHRQSYSWIKKADVVYNGLTAKNFPFQKKKKDYLAFVGPIRPEKGIKEAIQVSITTKTPLYIAGRVRPELSDYFEHEIKPLISSNPFIKFLGEINESQRNTMLKHAKAFLFPISWVEPFSMSLLESLAVGTPVIAFNKGSVPEVIINGNNGFIVDNVSEMAKAVQNIGKIDPVNCQLTIEERFSTENMTKGYLSLYNKYRQ